MKDQTSVQLFNETKNYILKYGGDGSFSPSLILVATWIKGTPYHFKNYLATNQVQVMNMFFR